MVTVVAPQLRFALRHYLGQPLTPEVAAHVEAMALYNALPVPECPSDVGVCAGQRPEYFAFLNEKLEAQYDPVTSRVIASTPGGVTRAVVVFLNASKWAIEMAIATDGSSLWAHKAFMRWAYRYPFVQLGKLRATVRIESDNEPSIAMCGRLGYVREGNLRHGFGGNDCLVMGMLAHECRWIGATP